jgi:hypothetical protein
VAVSIYPQKWLQQHSIVVQFSELFPRATNLPALVQAAYDAKFREKPVPPTVILDHALCSTHRNVTALQCLASGGSFWGRLFSGASLTFSVSQRDQVQQGVLLPELPASQGWGWNGQVDFNPASLFVTSANWKSAVAVLGKGPDGAPRNLKTADSAAESACFLQDPAHPYADKLIDCETRIR